MQTIQNAAKLYSITVLLYASVASTKH